VSFSDRLISRFAAPIREDTDGSSNTAVGALTLFTENPSNTFKKTHFTYEKGAGAGNGNRTRIASLEGWNFTIKLCPHRIVNSQQCQVTID
jgi:hypothetical protein